MPDEINMGARMDDSFRNQTKNSQIHPKCKNPVGALALNNFTGTTVKVERRQLGPRGTDFGL